jgi:hypothetical protein
MTMATRTNVPVFVFGSNEGGIHGAGAALFAYRQRGARMRTSYGHVSDSFAIPTLNQELGPLSLERIKQYVEGFLAYAAGHPELTFQVTRIGCGLAGLKDEQIAPMFMYATVNCQFDEVWKPILDASESSDGEPVETDYVYWGTF